MPGRKSRRQVLRKRDQINAGAGAASTATGHLANANPLALSTREYLDSTVSPVLLKGLQELDQQRPKDPIGYLAAFLMKYKDQQTNGLNTPDSQQVNPSLFDSD